MPRGMLPLQAIQPTIIDLTPSSPSDFNDDLPENPPESQGESFRADTPTPDTQGSSEAFPLVTEGLVPSAVPNVVELIEFDSFFEDTLPEVNSYVAEASISSTPANIQPLQPAPTVPLQLKEVDARDNSTVALRMRKFVDGLRATPQGLVNWLLGESKRSSVPSEEGPTSTSLPPRDALVEKSILSETPSYSESEVSTTLVHGEAGTPRVSLVPWSSVMDQPTPSALSTDMDLQQTMSFESFSLQDVHFSTPTSAPGRSGSVKLYRRWSGVIVPPSELLNSGNVSRHCSRYLCLFNSR
jgi:hypothetical protein